MKALLILLILWLLTVSYSKPTQVDPMDIRFFKLYPEWFHYSDEQKQDRIKIFELSDKKYLWFPDLYPVPTTILNLNN